MLLLVAGAAAATRVRWPWLAVAMFYLVIRIRFVAREEVHMLETFGDDYRRYCARVRRWFGVRAQPSRASRAL
jgi:protein-S-isoprenylcysteine O-methyltransferase Ste14